MAICTVGQYKQEEERLQIIDGFREPECFWMTRPVTS